MSSAAESQPSTTGARPRGRRRHVGASSVLVAVLVTLTVLFLLAPVIVVFGSSLTAQGYLQFPPEGLSLRWYGEIASRGEFLSAFYTSVQLAVATVAIGLLTAIPAALALYRQRNRLTSSLEQLFMSPLVLPAVVFGIAFLILTVNAGLSGTFVGALLAHVVLTTPFIVRNALVGLSHLDPAVIEASRSLGAGPVYTFWRVTLPALRASILTGAIFAFIISFDEAVATLFLVGPDFTTLPVAIFTYVQYSNDPTVAAISGVLVLISVGLLAVLSRLTDVTEHA